MTSTIITTRFSCGHESQITTSSEPLGRDRAPPSAWAENEAPRPRRRSRSGSIDRAVSKLKRVFSKEKFAKPKHDWIVSTDLCKECLAGRPELGRFPEGNLTLPSSEEPKDPGYFARRRAERMSRAGPSFIPVDPAEFESDALGGWIETRTLSPEERLAAEEAEEFRKRALEEAEAAAEAHRRKLIEDAFEKQHAEGTPR